MRKIIPFILIIVIVFANLFAPISVGWENKKVEVKKNKAEAAKIPFIDGTNEAGIKVTLDPSVKDHEIQFWVEVEWGDNNNFFSTNTFEIKRYLDDSGTKFETKEPSMSATPGKPNTERGSVIFDNLDPETTYKFDVYLYNKSKNFFQTLANIGTFFGTGGIGGLIFDEASDTGSLKNQTPYEITTLPSIEGGYTDFVPQEIDNGTLQNEAKTKEIMPACSITSGEEIMGCLAQGLYYLFFIPTSFLFAVAGTFFDWTFNYSVQSASYKSTFVVQGWNIVRDFCNMFFIFVLLYIAFKTILNLGGSKTKEMIINVVVIGLLINFSLFTTRIIIDASNILARVFYNSDAIKITAIENDGDLSNLVDKADNTGIIPMSAALVNKVNPQAIIINAEKVANIPDKADQLNDQIKKGGVTIGTFIIVTLLASAINVIGFIVFLTVGLIFVTRVVGLWLAMILSPIAFFSYTVPEMKGWGMVGATNWWPETLKLAFLAPVFMFFLYLILQFLEIGMGVLNTADKGVLGWLISVLVPFAFIMVLLMKAKSIAVKMAGQMGETVAKAGSAVGGLALGAGVGLGAMAMRGTMGKLGSMADKSSWINNMAGSKSKFASFVGNKLKDTSQFVGKSSFDVRNTKLGASAASGLGADLGKGKVGGYEKDRKDHVEKKQKRAEELKVHEDEEITQKINKEEIALQQVLNAVVEDFDLIEKKLAVQRQIKADNANSPARSAERAAHDAAMVEIGKLNKLKTALKDIDGSAGSIATAATIAGTLVDRTFGGTMATTASTLGGVVTSSGSISINKRENERIPDLKKQREKKNRERTTNYANNTSWGDKWYHGAGNREAKHKIIMGNKIESK